MKKYRFDQIAINSTKKKKPEENDRFCYIGLEHIDPGNFNISRWGAEAAPTGDKLLMKKGDVLFGKRRAYQRKVGIAPFDGIFSAHGMVLRPNEEIIDSEFFPFFISSDTFMDTAVRISVGGLSPTINWRDLAKQEFYLPSLNNQRILAKKLWAAYNLKQSYIKLLKATDEMVKSQFFGMIRDKERNSKLGDWVDTKIRKARKEFTSNDYIEYIDISSIDKELGEVVSTSNFLMKDAPSRAQQCVMYGDILLSTVRPNLRNIAVNQLKIENAVASSGFCVLRPHDGFTQMILATIKSDDFTNDMISIAKGSNYPAIHDYDVLSYPVYTPSEEELRLITDIISQSDKSKFELKKCIENIDNVIKSLINQQ